MFEWIGAAVGTDISAAGSKSAASEKLDVTKSATTEGMVSRIYRRDSNNGSAETKPVSRFIDEHRGRFGVEPICGACVTAKRRSVRSGSRRVGTAG